MTRENTKTLLKERQIRLEREKAETLAKLRAVEGELTNLGRDIREFYSK